MKYRLPAEWEPHEATWLAWPHYEKHWPGKFEPIPFVYEKIAHALAQNEKVNILVNDEAMENGAKKILGNNLNNIYFYRVPTNSSWTRDYGPIYVKDENGNLLAEDWIFNAWGGQWEYNLDDVVPQKIAGLQKIPLISTKLVLEGGSIDVNGKGSLLTTRQCLLNKNRNGNLTQKQIEKSLAEFLGTANILWLNEAVTGDDTSGHIDELARFTDANTIVCSLEENPADVNYGGLKKNYEDLLAMRDEKEKKFNVVPLPMPDPVIYQGQRLPASYCNFYIANSVVLVPVFNCPKDKIALETLQKLFPDRRVMGIDCVDLVWGLGTIHCSTQQQPK
ncbi:agmatine deiminase family protein [Patescibacteria group bacterium]|nr:MAG: agmatine deiminase family protein [Patescibacteria group bacterium]